MERIARWRAEVYSVSKFERSPAQVERENLKTYILLEKTATLDFVEAFVTSVTGIQV